MNKEWNFRLKVWSVFCSAISGIVFLSCVLSEGIPDKTTTIGSFILMLVFAAAYFVLRYIGRKKQLEMMTLKQKEELWG